ncbi:hypothetical protein NA57DRAFT_52183 [Rhizodiscina lignyota]|uniref:Uncharacterized protein n=1 Tax=Rhizodiscina lignyota TaxID=1504668 RepID=A0A9P4INR4_9PEZI|nr:hypothetical protein NA57DRAFT_52183 [Rhizodiscina lignyota]
MPAVALARVCVCMGKARCLAWPHFASPITLAQCGAAPAWTALTALTRTAIKLRAEAEAVRARRKLMPSRPLQHASTAGNKPPRHRAARLQDEQKAQERRWHEEANDSRSPDVWFVATCSWGRVMDSYRR